MRKPSLQSIISCALFILAVSIQASAQNLQTEEVDVVKNFEARLAESERFRLNPSLPPLDTLSQNLSYQIQPRSLNLSYPPPTIKPLAFRSDAGTKIYNGFVKAGAGYPLSLFLDGAYDYFDGDKAALGISLRHHAANNDKNIANQRFSYSKGLIDGKIHLDNGMAVNGKLGYTRDEVSFYGYNALNEFRDSSNLFDFDKEAVKQRFSIIDLGATVSNGELIIGDLNYEAKLDAYFFQDNYSSKENGMLLDLNAQKWFKENELQLGLIADLTNFRDTSVQNLNNFSFSPSFTIHGDNYRVKLGARATSSKDIFSFFPQIEASAGILGNLLHVFAGAEGNLDKNNFRKLTDYNPFLISTPILKNTKYYNFYGGLKGTLEGLNYQAKVAYKMASDLVLFLPNQDSIPRFDVLYDNVNIINLNAAINGHLMDNLSITASLNQNVYRAETQEKAWLLPAFTLQIGAEYRMLEEKLALRASLFTENGIPFLNSAGETERLNALFDISTGANYRIAENLEAFVQLSNIANNRRQRWTNYPVFGMNALAGLSARF